MKHMLRSSIGLTAALAVIVIAGSASVAGQKQEEFRFRSGVDLVNVTATVIDRNGRFVPGLRQEDFIVYEENELQEVTHFSNERVPVSLGIVLDTSGSMVGEKLTNALMAVDRFLTKLLSPEDEIFLYKFSNFPELVQDWTTDRQRLSRAIRRINASGGTAMYDAIAESVPLAQTGQHRKRAVVLISDGNDTDSQVSLSEVKQLIRESEVMVYAIGIDGQAEGCLRVPADDARARCRRRRCRVRFPAAGVREGPEASILPQTAAVPVAVSAGSGTQDACARQRRSRQRERAARDHRRQRRPHGSRALGPRPRSGHGEHRRRAEPAVLSRLLVDDEERRPLACDSRGNARQVAARPRAPRLYRDALASW